MGKIIAIANQKGGVGKTTTAINLGAALTRNNYNVLIVDLDEKANATISLGVERQLVEVSSYHLLIDNIDISTAIINTREQNLDIIPGLYKLSRLERKVDCMKINVLYEKLQEIKKYYDFILLDCPPSLGLIVDYALYAADSVIIPVECDYLAYDALMEMVIKINEIQKKKSQINESLSIEGVLLTKLDNRIALGYKIIEKVKSLFPIKTFQTVINRSSHLQEAPMYGKSVIEFSSTSRGSKEYKQLAKEILSNGGLF